MVGCVCGSVCWWVGSDGTSLRSCWRGVRHRWVDLFDRVHVCVCESVRVSGCEDTARPLGKGDVSGGYAHMCVFGGE